MEHKQLASGRWYELSFAEQMANIGSEIIRTISWLDKGNKDYSDRACNRALELLSFTISDPANIGRLKELTRLKECWLDFVWGNNIYRQTKSQWQKYFYAFTYLAQNRKNK